MDWMVYEILYVIFLVIVVEAISKLSLEMLQQL